MITTDEKVTVACVSFEPWKWHKRENTARLEFLFETAVAAGAALVVTPEAALDGYALRDAIDDPTARLRFLELAEPLHGDSVQQLRRAARLLRASIVFGMAERSGRRSVHTSALFVGPTGDVLGVHRKLHFAEGNDPSWYFSRMGTALRAFDTPFGRAGMMVCHDRWDPLIARGLVLDGARLLFVPTHGNRSRAQDRAILARARENGVPVLQANVGLNIIVSDGEIVARDEGRNLITLATIQIRCGSSERAARRVEKEMLGDRPERMAANTAKYLASDAVSRRLKDRSFTTRPRWPTPRIRDHRPVVSRG